MGGKDDDPRSDLDKWLDGQRVEIDKIRQQFQDGIDRELRSWNHDASSSSMKGPFERFKDFVDSNVSTFAQGFKNFPSNVTELKASMQEEREARRREELELSSRWVGTDDSPDHIRMQVERLSSDERQSVKDATYMLLRESYQRNKHVPAEKILKLYQDNEWSFGALDRFATPMLSMGGACYYKTETVENLPSTARWAWPTPKPQWLSIDWFKRSPYSPVRLEVHPELEGSGQNWRAAFEDLLCAALDKPMVSEEKVGVRIPYGNPQSTYRGPGLEWMLSLQCRGILPPQLPSLYKPVRIFDGFDEVRRPRAAEFMHDMDSITADKSTRMYPLVKRDLNLLMDEIAIKSTPPKVVLQPKIPQSPWRVPETEEELYDDMPPYTDLVLPDEEREVSKLPGKRCLDGTDFGDGFWEALEEEDYDFVIKSLQDYLVKHGDEEEVQRPIQAEELKQHQRRLLEREQAARNTEAGRAETGLAEYFEHSPVKDKNETKHSESAKRPDILSQLTTTHTTRMPDGSVTTKVVLKQRFADGREEVHESVQTSRDEASHIAQPEQKSEEKKQPQKKGWFWN